MRFTIIIGFFLVAFVSGCATTPNATRTPLEIQAVQSHKFQTNKEIGFAAVMTVFQNLGYIIRGADLKTGFITAASASSNSTGFWDAMAGVTSNTQTKVTAFVEQINKKTINIRLNFLKIEQRSAQYGQATKKGSRILNPKIYQNAFKKIGNAIFVREGTG